MHLTRLPDEYNNRGQLDCRRGAKTCDMRAPETSEAQSGACPPEISAYFRNNVGLLVVGITSGAGRVCKQRLWYHGPDFEDLETSLFIARSALLRFRSRRYRNCRRSQPEDKAHGNCILKITDLTVASPRLTHHHRFPTLRPVICHVRRGRRG